MKQTIVSILCMLACLTGNTQTVTFDISGGYCIPLAGGTEPIERKVGTGTTFPYYYTTYASVRKKSYGQGGSLALNLNWYSKKSIGFGVKVNFLIGGSAPYTINVYDGSNVEFSTYRDKPFAFQFIPHACFRYDYKVVSPVLEAGMIIGVAHIDRQATIKANYSQRIIQTTTRDFGGALIGFYSSVGMSFNVTPVFKINLAMNCTAGSYSPTRWNRTKFTVDGVDQLQALNTASREGTYVKELDFRASQSNSAPSKDIKYSAPFSSIGVTVGLCFKFGKKPKKVQKGKEPNVIQPY